MGDTQDAGTRDRITRLIDTGRISTLFQPVVSIDRKTIAGFEAFSRGRLDDEHLLNSTDMFDSGVPPEQLLSLDAICCHNSLKRFSKFLLGHPSLCLFLNIDGSVLDHVDHARHFLAEMTHRSQVPPANIAIEIAANHMKRPAVQDFARNCRDGGYLLSIDRVRKKTSVLEKLLQIKPDYVKLSPDMWGDPDDTLYNMDNVRIITRACRSNGCQPIAVGVENEDEALYLMQCDIFMQQGYYYTSSRKTPARESAQEGSNVSGFLETINHVHEKYTQLRKEIIADKRERFDRRHKVMQRAGSKFTSLLPDEFEDALKAVMADQPEIVSGFVIDGDGRQITRRIPRDGVLRSPKTQAAIRSKGLDHSMTDYHLHLLMGYERFVCPPDASPFLPRRTTLIAMRFFTGLEKPYVLCIEFA